MRSLAVYAVVYPAAIRYLSAFWRSLEVQLESGFEVYLSLDGVSEAEVRSYLGGNQAVNMLPASHGSSPAEIRGHALKYLSTQHDGVVLLDCDDVLLPGRLSVAREALARYDVYGCSLQVVDETGTPLTGAVLSTTWPLTNPQLATLLSRTNVFGFSNTAYRSDMLRQCITVEPDAIVMDWLVASRAYLAGAAFVFDVIPRMHYRQYGSNTARVLPPFSPTRVLTDAERVVNHFRFLLEAKHGSKRDVGPFLEAREAATAFLTWLTAAESHESEGNLARYCASLNALPFRTFLWWEHVAAVPVYGPTASSQLEIIEWSPA